MSRLASDGVRGPDGKKRTARVVRVGKQDAMSAAASAVSLDEQVGKRLAAATEGSGRRPSHKQIEKRLLVDAEIVCATTVAAGLGASPPNPATPPLPPPRKRHLLRYVPQTFSSNVHAAVPTSLLAPPPPTLPSLTQRRARHSLTHS